MALFGTLLLLLARVELKHKLSVHEELERANVGVVGLESKRGVRNNRLGLEWFDLGARFGGFETVREGLRLGLMLMGVVFGLLVKIINGHPSVNVFGLAFETIMLVLSRDGLLVAR